MIEKNWCVHNRLPAVWEALWTVSNEQTKGRGFGSLQTRLLSSGKVKSRDEGRDEILDCKQFIVMKKFSFSAEVHFLRQLQTRLHFFIPCKKERKKLRKIVLHRVSNDGRWCKRKVQSQFWIFFHEIGHFFIVTTTDLTSEKSTRSQWY